MIDIRACRWYRIQGQILYVIHAICYSDGSMSLEGIPPEGYGAYESHYQLVEYQGNYYTKADIAGIPFPALLTMEVDSKADIEEITGIVDSTAVVIDVQKALPAPGEKRTEP